MKKIKTAFVAFFPVIPNNMGSSTVVNSRFKSWKAKKKLFQLSHINKINNKEIKTIYLNKESPINKILLLPKLIFEIFCYLKDSKKKIIVIEGASWIFYSFIVFITFKLIFYDSKIIYISHSIESEIRKKYASNIIYYITLFLEKIVFKNVDLVTAVSKEEKRRIKNIYKVDTILYPNSININHKAGKKIIKDDYLIYSGSYFYKPNKYAIDYLNMEIMPKLIKSFPKIKLVITGGGFNKKYPWIINKDLVPKKELYDLTYNALCLCVPLKFGSGTRIKIIEALCLGTIVISTSKGIEGIELKKKNPPFIIKNKDKLIRTLNFIIKNKKKIKKLSIKDRKFYLNKFSMKVATDNFLKDNLKYFFY